MELANITVSSNMSDREQQKQTTSLVGINSNQQELIDNNCSQKQQQYMIEQPSTSLSSILDSPKPLMPTSISDDNESKHSGSDYCKLSMSTPEICEQDQKVLVKFVYTGQAVLLFIVALLWVIFNIFERNPELIIGNITTTQNDFYNISVPPT